LEDIPDVSGHTVQDEPDETVSGSATNKILAVLGLGLFVAVIGIYVAHRFPFHEAPIGLKTIGQKIRPKTIGQKTIRQK
jgi:hypothetical protein